MARVFIPPALRMIAAGRNEVEISAGTVGEIVEQLDNRYPGFRSGVCQGERLRPGLAVTVNGTIATLGLRQAIPPDAEVHFLPALGGG